MNLNLMFDTNILDRIIDGNLNIQGLSCDCQCFVTHIQRDEIEAIKDPEKQDKKRALLQVLTSISLEKIPTESAIWDISRWDEAKFAAEDNLIDELRKGNLKHSEDALIGETAIRNNMILVTDDSTLSKRVKALGGRAITFEQLLNREFVNEK